jgi:hypothetical protein
VDFLTVSLAVLLAATLTAFFAGWFPYPFGWLVIGCFLIARVLHLRKKGSDPFL